MRPFIVIRSYEIADAAARKEIIRKYVMSFAFEAFMSCIFREVRSSFKKRIFLFRNLTKFWLHENISDFHSIDCICGGDDVYFCWSSITSMLYGDTISYCIHLFICLWNLHNESHGIEFGKLPSNKFD